MYKLKDLENTPRVSYSVRNIQENFSIERLLDFINTSNTINYTARNETYPYNLRLKFDSEFVPIINIFSSGVSVINDINLTDLKRNIKSLISPGLKPLFKGDINKLTDILDAPIAIIYSTLINETDGAYTLNIPVRGRRGNSVVTRVKDLQDIIDSNTVTKLFTSYKATNNLLIYPYYYVVNDTIVFSMMIKKERIPNFRRNWYNSEIDPLDVEIWIDKEYFENNDKTTFSKWIKETFIMKLVMQGFVIKVKEDINSEVINIPRIKPVKTIEEMNSLKKAINNMML